MRKYFRTGHDDGLTKGLMAWLADPLFAPACESEQLKERLTDIVLRGHGAQGNGALFLNTEKEKGTVNLQGKSTKDIRCRVLLLIGQRDVSRFHDIARELGENVPSISTITVPSAGHMANLEHPDFVWNQIETFLSN
jgi:pimeloyl-ACP methyl ester carboxylesterase